MSTLCVGPVPYSAGIGEVPVEIILGALGALFVAAAVIDIRARRRGRRLRMDDHNDIYRTVPYAAPDLGPGVGGGADGGGGGA
jgi:hypothetical protein